MDGESPAAPHHPIMSGLSELGRVVLVVGVVLVVAGLVLMIGGKVPWLGRLPGDITIQRGNSRFYFPLVTCLLLSLLVTLVLRLFRH